MPTEKRQRQKQGRRERLESERKAKKRQQFIRRTGIAVGVAVVVVGTVVLLTNNNSGSSSATTTSTSPTTSTTLHQSAAQAKQDQLNLAADEHGCSANPGEQVNRFQFPAAPPMTINTSANYTAVLNTDAGPITVHLLTQQAPTTVNNFIFLAKEGFYRCVTFHRVIPQFMNQTGDPSSSGSGGPGYTIPDENPAAAADPAHQYPLGAVAMANTGQPHSGGSQFFIVAGPTGEGLPNSYALFGQVTGGMNAVMKINRWGSTENNGVPPRVTFRIYSVSIVGPN